VGKFDAYKIPLKELSVGTHTYEFSLDNNFFKNIDGPEVQKGKVNVHLTVKRGGQAFEMNFDIAGVVQVPCDRCLDDMDQEIECTNQLIVKFGKDYDEESDKIIVIPETEGEINLAWFLYEFVALNIPIRHIHPPGKCSKSMTSKLKKHVATSKDDDGEAWEEDSTVDFIDDGEELDTLKGETNEKETDPRWDGLKNLIEDN
jgi:uncharacterized metal-binding protein YceD (DUF177 family)